MRLTRDTLVRFLNRNRGGKNNSDFATKTVLIMTLIITSLAAAAAQNSVDAAKGGQRAIFKSSLRQLIKTSGAGNPDAPGSHSLLLRGRAAGPDEGQDWPIYEHESTGTVSVVLPQEVNQSHINFLQKLFQRNDGAEIFTARDIEAFRRNEFVVACNYDSVKDFVENANYQLATSHSTVPNFDDCYLLANTASEIISLNSSDVSSKAKKVTVVPLEQISNSAHELIDTHADSRITWQRVIGRNLPMADVGLFTLALSGPISPSAISRTAESGALSTYSA